MGGARLPVEPSPLPSPLLKATPAALAGDSQHCWRGELGKSGRFIPVVAYRFPLQDGQAVTSAAHVAEWPGQLSINMRTEISYVLDTLLPRCPVPDRGCFWFSARAGGGNEEKLQNLIQYFQQRNKAGVVKLVHGQAAGSAASGASA